MGIRKVSRIGLEKVVARFGYELRTVGSPPCGYSTFLARVARDKTPPRTVFDVGVARGTPWLYAAFPTAHFVLIEPQTQFEPDLQRICREMDAEYHLVGVGAQSEQKTFYRLLNSPTGSSFLQPNAYTTQRWGHSEKLPAKLPIVPLDSFAEQQGPFFVKIDTEGFELQVLKGAKKVLEQANSVLIEVALTQRQVDEPDLIEIGSFMKEHGFRLVDFPSLVQQAPGGPLVYLDAAFTKEAV